MLLLRYQRQRAQELEGGESSYEFDMRRKINDRDLKGENHRAATRSTLICIFVCGSLLLSLGLVLLLSGLLVPKLKKDPTPWLVTGPTCIVLGILVLLLSVEIILKLRKISTDDSDQSDPYPAPVKAGWGSTPVRPEDPIKDEVEDISRTIPVIIQAPTPMQQLDPSTLPQTIPDRR